MEKEGVVWLRKIKDGSIKKYLTEYSELGEYTLSNPKRKVTYKIAFSTVDLNKKSLFPKRKILQNLAGCSYGTVEKSIHYLKHYTLMIDLTITELLNVFGIRRGALLYLPWQLDHATYYDLPSTRNRWHGTSLCEKMRNPRTPNDPLYSIALVAENGVPIWREAFSFLKRYKQ